MPELTQEEKPPYIVTLNSDEQEIATQSLSDDALTNRELNGWKLFPLASGAFSIMIVLTAYLLTTLATQSGFELDLVTPCRTEVIGYKCVTKFGFWYIDTANYTRYISAITTAVKCVIYISLGSLADHGDMIWLAGLLSIVSVASSHIATVFYLAYIPTYTRVHSKLIESKANNSSLEEMIKDEDKVSSTFTTHSAAIGSASFILICFIQIGIAKLMNNDPYNQQVTIAFIGFWGIVFYTIPLYMIRDRKNPPLPSGQSYFSYSIKRFFKTIPKLYHLRQFSKYLIANILILNSILNHVITIILLATNLLPSFNSTKLAISTVIFPIGSIFGMYFSLYIQRKFDISVKTITLISIGCYSLAQIFELIGSWVKPIDSYSYESIFWYTAVFRNLFAGVILTYKVLLAASIMPPNADNEFTSLCSISHNQIYFEEENFQVIVMVAVELCLNLL
ncbi:15696_t:CDS:2 [Funneliformis mosseae]|uniref:Autophagy-related protein n=1 Tax=Funneliformis mosseae TaxID=27381 RepID=A0A9N8WMP9_FUNMO|nr:15696_t:CDS:2 [Funneliformis mosseae]